MKNVLLFPLSLMGSYPKKLVGAAVAVLLFALPAYANNVTVGCAGSSGTFDYSSITAALNAVPDGSQISVSGTCDEAVSIYGRHNLTINGVSGSTTLQAVGVTNPIAVLGIGDSDGITIQNLEILDSPTVSGATVHISGSNVDFQGMTIQGVGGNDSGLFIQQHSFVFITASHIQDYGVGIEVGNGGLLWLGNTEPNDSVPDVIQRNSSYGIVTSGSVGVFGATELQNNFIGVAAEDNGAVSFCCGANQRKVVDNQVGIAILNGGSLEMNGPALISGNQVYGVRLLGGYATFNGSQTIRGNAIGIIAQGNSHLDLFSTDVSDNTGSGVILTDNSSARIYGDTIIGNSGAGLTLTHISTAQLFGGNTISANGGVDLTCSPDSLGYGDKSGIGKVACPGFDVEPVPGHPR